MLKHLFEKSEPTLIENMKKCLDQVEKDKNAGCVSYYEQGVRMLKLYVEALEKDVQIMKIGN